MMRINSACRFLAQLLLLVIIMSGCKRNLGFVRSLIQSCNGFSSEQTRQFYDGDAETYETVSLDALRS